MVQAAYWPPTQELLTGRTVVEVEAGGKVAPVNLTLEDSPEWRRLVVCRGRISVVRRVYVGTDDWAHSPINLQTQLTLAPATWGQPPPDYSIRTTDRVVTSPFAQRFHVRVDLRLELHEDLSVEVSARSALCAHYYDHSRSPMGDEIVTTGRAALRTLRPGESTEIVFNHNSGHAPPDRAHIEFTVETQRAPAKEPSMRDDASARGRSACRARPSGYERGREAQASRGPLP